MSLRINTFLIFCISFCQLHAQNSWNIQKSLDWNDTPTIHSPMGIHKTEIWEFDGSEIHPEHPSLPLFNTRFRVPSKGTLKVNLIQAQYEAFDKKPSEGDAFLKEEIYFNARIDQNRRDHFGKVSFIPVRLNANGQYERLVSFELAVKFTPAAGIDANVLTPPPPIWHPQIRL